MDPVTKQTRTSARTSHALHRERVGEHVGDRASVRKAHATHHGKLHTYTAAWTPARRAHTVQEKQQQRHMYMYSHLGHGLRGEVRGAFLAAEGQPGRRCHGRAGGRPHPRAEQGLARAALDAEEPSLSGDAGAVPGGGGEEGEGGGGQRHGRDVLFALGGRGAGG